MTNGTPTIPVIVVTVHSRWDLYIDDAGGDNIGCAHFEIPDLPLPDRDRVKRIVADIAGLELDAFNLLLRRRETDG